MKKFTLEIKKIVIITGRGADKVYVETTLPPPFPLHVSDDDLNLTFEVVCGGGVDYVKKHFGIDPEVLGLPEKKFKFSVEGGGDENP